jgi:hypothetical protein
MNYIIKKKFRFCSFFTFRHNCLFISNVNFCLIFTALEISAAMIIKILIGWCFFFTVLPFMPPHPLGIVVVGNIQIPHCSTPFGVVGDMWTFVFYKHLNPNGFIPYFIGYFFFINNILTNDQIPTTKY